MPRRNAVGFVFCPICLDGFSPEKSSGERRALCLFLWRRLMSCGSTAAVRSRARRFFFFRHSRLGGFFCSTRGGKLLLALEDNREVRSTMAYKSRTPKAAGTPPLKHGADVYTDLGNTKS